MELTNQQEVTSWFLSSICMFVSLHVAKNDFHEIGNACSEIHFQCLKYHFHCSLWGDMTCVLWRVRSSHVLTACCLLPEVKQFLISG